MSELTSVLSELSPIKRVERYQQLASIVLDSYAFVTPSTPELLQHNSGITYRVPVRDTTNTFCSKIHDPIGEAIQPHLPLTLTHV